MVNLRYAEGIVVAGTPEELYDMVCDVTRMGEWSPVCRACWWDDGESARVGAWFTGRNELPERTGRRAPRLLPPTEVESSRS